MPHHAVIREQKDSSKLRIVFDASSNNKDNLSLNDCLESGPNLNPDLLKIILKFRLHKIAFCADIQRAFLEIGIAEEDREYLKFLWFKGGFDPSTHNMETLKYARVAFGVKCSPFLLAATLKLHLEKYKDQFLKEYEMLQELYVDDLITGTSEVDAALELSKNIKFMLSEASMNIRKWVSNSKFLNETWHLNKMGCRETSEEAGVPLKVLGLIWDNVNDSLKFDVSQFEKLNSTQIITKRVILAACGMLFDPIGFLNPFTVKVKLLLQSIWEGGFSWDECLSHEIETLFFEWLKDIDNIKHINIPRIYFINLNWESIEVHIFSDASPKCYGSVAYFRSQYNDGYATNFIISKSRLAPTKKVTLPRLELLGTLISSRLGTYLRKTFPMLKEKNIFYYTDSQICMHWIRGTPDEWKQFVRNRVIEIKENTLQANWCFCPGKCNPADRLTRGVNARSMINDELWLKGPPWLSEGNISHDSARPASFVDLNGVENERCKLKTVVLHTNTETVEPLLVLENYSDLNKVLRITAYIFRFINNCKSTNEKQTGTVTTSELSSAKVFWIQTVQRKEFETEYLQLKNNSIVSPNSKLSNLNPFLTSDNLLALKGRLQQSDFDFQSKHPFIIPNKCKFTELLINDAHVNLCHAGVSDTLTQLREYFWIIKGRQAVKSCLNKCLRCRRFKVKQGTQVIAPLPANRVTTANAFEVVAIDFAGPLYSKDSEKNYIALFTCAVTRAIHLEVVSSLSTEHFLLAFRRFISRRGVCKTINSDNALTFKSADSELKKLYENITDPVVQNFFGKKGITWQYIVERAAWWGGYWERMVKVTKIALRKILGRAFVSFEELLTILAEIESIINSRPLTYVYNEPDEPFPLTPANFLTGRRLTCLPQWFGNNNKLDIPKGKKDLIKRFLYREKLLNNFWKRWRGEYLLQLKGANLFENVNARSNFNINDIVLLGDDKLPRQLWKVGRIKEVHKGRDNNIRAVTIKTASGVIRRPVQLIYNLEIGNV